MPGQTGNGGQCAASKPCQTCSVFRPTPLLTGVTGDQRPVKQAHEGPQAEAVHRVDGGQLAQGEVQGRRMRRQRAVHCVCVGGGGLCVGRVQWVRIGSSASIWQHAKLGLQMPESGICADKCSPSHHHAARQAPPRGAPPAQAPPPRWRPWPWSESGSSAAPRPQECCHCSSNRCLALISSNGVAERQCNSMGGSAIAGVSEHNPIAGVNRHNNCS